MSVFLNKRKTCGGRQEGPHADTFNSHVTKEDNGLFGTDRRYVQMSEPEKLKYKSNITESNSE